MNKLREIRESKGLKLREVADRAETSIQQIQRLEKGERRLTTDWLQRLAKALDCRPGEIVPDLAGGDDDWTWIGRRIKEQRLEGDAAIQALKEAIIERVKEKTDE